MKQKTELEILKEVKNSFQFHSDYSADCNGYHALCRKIERLEQSSPSLSPPINQGTVEESIKKSLRIGFDFGYERRINDGDEERIVDWINEEILKFTNDPPPVSPAVKEIDWAIIKAKFKLWIEQNPSNSSRITDWFKKNLPKINDSGQQTTLSPELREWTEKCEHLWDRYCRTTGL